MFRRILLVCCVVSALVLVMINFVYAQETGPQAVDAALDTAFTYQGQLKSGGTGVTGSCEMAFRLFDAATLGLQVGAPLTQTVAVSAGLFTTQLDFGVSAFNGQERWLEIAVKCASDVGFTTLKQRQELTAAPYAVYSPSTGALRGRSIASTAPTIQNSVLSASGGTSNYGIWNSANVGTYIVKVNNSQITGSTNTISNDNNYITRVGASLLSDGATSANDGTVTCAGVYDENYTFYASTCP